MVDEEPPSGCDIAKLMNICYSEVKALRSGNAMEAKKVSSGHWDNPSRECLLKECVMY